MSTLKVNNLEDLGADPVAVNGVLVKSAFPAGTILQVVSTTKSNVFSASIAGNVLTPVTGLTATITPTSSSSTVLVLVSVNGSTDLGAYFGFVIKRGATTIAVGSGASFNVTSIGMTAGNGTLAGITHMDTPATTSSVTYSIEAAQKATGGTATLYVNRDFNNSNSMVSSITLMEVAG